ncbi:MAG: DNA helicase RecQ [Anditalea sp.]
MTPQPIDILNKKFGFPAFRHHQKEIISRVLSKKDTFVLMPTGGGKSLCYQIPALIFEGVTIVISPLIALMKDQVDALRVNGIAAAFLNSTQSQLEQSDTIRQLENKQLKLLYLAPERLLGNDGQFIVFLKRIQVSLIAIDEAHCISQWGHDFRPEYLMLAKLKQELPKVPVIALTATADKLTQKDILSKLALKTPQTFLSSFNRANIQYFVEPKRNSYQRLLNFLSGHEEDSGIIYTLSRQSTEDLAARLTAEGYAAKPYHAGLERQVRQQHQELFLKDDIKIIVATIAFGMGIDKSNVRYVAHMDLPKNLESYYQETGRAGRDGLPCQAMLFYSYADVMKLKGFAEVENNAEQTRIMLKKLDQMAEFCQIRFCRRKYLLNYFDEEAPDQCGGCDVCLTEYEKIDGTVIAQKALSAVARLDERFGMNYVVDFLRGSRSEKLRPEHKALKTYGVGADLSKEDWMQYIKDLLAQNYLQKSEGEYPVLKLAQKSTAVLRGKEKVMLIKLGERAEILTETPPYEAGLFLDLKALRNQFAIKENVPPYVIFSDATLIELSTYLPQNKPEMKQISGFGEIKLEKYGKEFQEKIVRYCQEHQLQSRIRDKKPKRQKKASKERTTDTKLSSFESYKEGLSVAEIAKERNLSPQTIEGHLAHFILEGSIEVTELVPESKIPAIIQAIQAHGDAVLGSIKQALGEEVSYGEIKAVINYLKKSKKIP